MIVEHFATLARYNQWANIRLYRMTAKLPDDAYRKNAGIYFGSLHGTLNHILVADLIWMHRVTGTGYYPQRVDAILHQDFASLHAARQAEDARIVAFVAALTEPDLRRVWDYRALDGAPHRQPLHEILSHLFNHQTHHRGQAHAALTIAGLAEPEALDLLIMQRERR